jgi:hypothetical protein
VHVRANEAAEALHAQTKMIHEMGRELEDLTRTARYAMRAYERRWRRGLCGSKPRTYAIMR